MRHVLRLRDLGRLRAGAQRHPAGAGLVLPHAAAQRRHLAHRGHALGAALRVAVPAAHAGHHLAAVHPHPGLADHGPRGLHGLRVHRHLDRAVPGRHDNDFKIQTRLTRRPVWNLSLNRLVVKIL